jgi:hypothetical protein
MTPPLTEYPPKRLPWPGRLSRLMARRLWDGLAPFINMAQAEAEAMLLPFGLGPIGVYGKMRSSLHELAAGRLRLDGFVIPAAPLCLIRCRGGRVSWGLRHVDPLRAASPEHLEALRAECQFLLALLALPKVRPLLKQCATCGTFKPAKAVKPHKKTGTRRDFCSPACRRRAATREDNRRRQSQFRSHRFHAQR